MYIASFPTLELSQSLCPYILPKLPGKAPTTIIYEGITIYNLPFSDAYHFKCIYHDLQAGQIQFTRTN